ncbi:MAG: anti-sigma F factor [Bacillota bacterium]|jgi:stage II sporulation protein AB (anti-sigma F factor)|nr:anti-sigma F factor [Bacillota bacterium]
MEGQVIRVRVELESVPSILGFARVAAAALASGLDFGIDRLDDVKLAVSEAVSNCIVHAYPNGPGPIVMEMKLNKDQFEVTVIDEGVGIADVSRARTPGCTSDPTRMGMGFTLMEALSDHLDVVSQEGEGTQVTMRFSARK